MSDTDKLASLLLDTSKPYRVTLTNASTKQPFTGKDGRKAFVAVYCKDSGHARKYRLPDGLSDEEKAADYLAYLTSEWLLIGGDGAVIDLPYSRETARKLYGNPDAVDIFDQVWAGAFNRGNFARASSSS